MVWGGMEGEGGRCNRVVVRSDVEVTPISAHRRVTCAGPLRGAPSTHVLRVGASGKSATKSETRAKSRAEGRTPSEVGWGEGGRMESDDVEA